MNSYESPDSFCWLVHFVRALLARRVAGTYSIPNRLASVPTTSPHRYRCVGYVRFAPCNIVSAGPSAGMEAEDVSVSCGGGLIRRGSPLGVFHLHVDLRKVQF
jgi:hypothetical protein